MANGSISSSSSSSSNNPIQQKRILRSSNITDNVSSSSSSNTTTTTTTTRSIVTSWDSFNTTDDEYEYSEEMINFLHSSVVGPCNCLNRRYFFVCCQRAIIVVHKMGVTAAATLRQKYFLPMHKWIATAEILSEHKHGRFFESGFRIPFSDDYRHVILTRNWYDAIISGYLYHKSGKECWLDWFGQPYYDKNNSSNNDNNNNNSPGWLYNNTSENWEQRLVRYFHRHSTSSNNNSSETSSLFLQQQPDHVSSWRWPPGKGRDLCRYLADESEEDGLRVYTAWALASHLDPLLQFCHRRLQRERERGWNRTTFLCFEQLIHPSTYKSTVFDLFRWFFPNQMPHHNVTNLQRVYDGGHATNPDPALRSRLRHVLSTLDAEQYHGKIAQASLEFGCASMMMSNTTTTTT